MPTTFQGKPCKRGHNGLRYVKGGACVHCMLERDRRMRGTVPTVPTVPAPAVSGESEDLKSPDLCVTPGCTAKPRHKSLWCDDHEPSLVVKRRVPL